MPRLKESGIGLRDLDALAAKAIHEPLEIDISDHGDEWCNGFLAGQLNAIQLLCRRLAERPE